MNFNFIYITSNHVPDTASACFQSTPQNLLYPDFLQAFMAATLIESYLRFLKAAFDWYNCHDIFSK